MNIVTIDPSQNSTAMVINGKLFNYVKQEDALLKSGKMNKWFDLCSQHVDINTVDLGKPKGYSNTETHKLGVYSGIAHQIKNHVIETINPSRRTIVVMEGYSYSSAAGRLIDLVTIGTLIRKNLSEISLSELHIISPTNLKLRACQMTYEPVDIGKRKPKLVHQNHEGVKGGSFKKHEMYKAITENNGIDCGWKDFLLEYQDDVMASKKVPKPIDDINDAFIMYQIVSDKIKSDIPLDFK